MAAALPTYAGVIHNYILTSIAVSPASAALIKKIKVKFLVKINKAVPILLQ